MRKPLVFLFLMAILVLSFVPEHKTTLYIFPKPAFFPDMPVAVSYTVTNEGVELGRHLFYDPILSADSTMACASCHKQRFAFSDSSVPFSKGISAEAMQRNTMPLFNLAWYPALFWDGRAASIEEQVFHPVRTKNEMNLSWADATERVGRSKLYRSLFNKSYGKKAIDSVLIAKSIAQFLRTLISYQSKFDRVLIGKDSLTKEEEEGFILMNDQTKGDCLHCHTSDADALGTTARFSNNGLDTATLTTSYRDKGRGGVTGKSNEMGQFKIPSLRNVALTAPYMHDGRFNTLAEVIEFYSTGVKKGINADPKMGSAHRGGVKLSPMEKEKIIAFLNTMTDSVFISNPQFSNPFTTKR